MSIHSGLLFVGDIEDGVVKAEVYLDGEPLTMEGRLWLTLDQWQALRRESDAANQYYLWVCTKAEVPEMTEPK